MTREKYISLSLEKIFVEYIKEHIKEKPEYRSVADFCRHAIRNQINYEKCCD